MQPRLGESPLPLHRGGSEFEDAGGGLDIESAEEAEFDDAGLDGIEGRESVEGFVEGEHLDRGVVGDEGDVVEGGASPAAAPLLRPAGASVVDEDAAHGSRGEREELGPGRPAGVILTDESEVRLVDESGGLEGVSGALLAHEDAGEIAEFAREQIVESIDRAFVAGPGLGHQGGDAGGTGGAGLGRRIHGPKVPERRSEEKVKSMIPHPAGSRLFLHAGDSPSAQPPEKPPMFTTRNAITTLVAGLMGVGTAHATEIKYWVASPGGDFHDGSNWSDSLGGPGGAGAPLATDKARVQAAAGESFAVTLDASTAPLFELRLSGPGAASLTMSDHVITADTVWISGGPGGSSVLDISGGMINATDVFRAGSALATGVINLSGDGEINTDAGYLGYDGLGEMHQSGGGFFTESGLDLGTSGDGFGHYEISDGVLDVSGGLRVGGGGDGLFHQTGGLVMTGWLITSTVGEGEVLIDGGVFEAGSVTLGFGSHGELVQSGGEMTVLGNLRLTNSLGSTANWTMTGGVLNAATVIISGNGPSLMQFVDGVATADIVKVFDGDDDGADLIVAGGSLATDVVENKGTIGFSFGTFQVGAFENLAGGVLYASRYSDLEIGGDATFDADGRVVYAIGEPVQTGDILVDGVATLGGTLEVFTFGGYTAAAGDEFAILVANEIAGAFDAVELPVLAGDLSWALDIDATSVMLRVVEPPAPGDLDGDGVVDAADLSGLLAGWGVCDGACPADLNNDGVVDAGDLSVLLANWG